MKTPRILTEQQVARRLGVHPRTLQRWRSQGKFLIPHLRLPGVRRYAESAVTDWLKGARP